MVGSGLLFPTKDIDGNLELIDAALAVFDRRRSRGLTQSDACAGGVEQG